MSTAAPPLAETKTPVRARSSRRFVILGLIVLIAVAAGLWFSGIFSTTESTDDAQVDGHINSISARVSGYVTSVNVEDNQEVKAGATLVTIDPRDYQVALDKAKADLADAVATAKAAQLDIPITTSTTSNTLANTQAGEQDAQKAIAGAQRAVAASQARLASAQARLAQEQANYDRAQDDEKRYKQLVDKQEISDQQYRAAVDATRAQAASIDSARASIVEAQQNVDASNAQLDQFRARLDQARTQVSTAMTGPEQVATARARWQSAQAKVMVDESLLSQAQLNLSYTTILAPVSGAVGRKTVEVGQNVSVGQQLMAIVPTDDIWITANFKETQLKKMRPGEKVKVHVDTYGRDYTGHVESIAGASGAKFSLLPPENATGNYVKVVQRVPVRIRLDQGQDPDHLLRPGMSVVPHVYVQ